MENYKLPQPAECVDFQNETMLINEGPLHIVIDPVCRSFKGSNSESLAKEVFEELVIIQDKKLLVDSLELSRFYGFRLVESREQIFYIVNEKNKILSEFGDIRDAHSAFIKLTKENQRNIKNKIYQQEHIVDEYGISLHKGRDRNVEYWITNLYGQNSFKNVSFEKAFLLFYRESLNTEKDKIFEGEIVDQMGNFKIVESREPNKAFFVIDGHNFVYKKYRDLNLANESLESIYMEKAIYHSVEVFY